MKQSIKLIEGNFTDEQAREVILTLLDFKIQYHGKQNFSSEIRGGKEDERSLRRKEELEETKASFLDYLANQSNTGSSYEVFCTIEITRK